MTLTETDMKAIICVENFSIQFFPRRSFTYLHKLFYAITFVYAAQLGVGVFLETCALLCVRRSRCRFNNFD